MMDTEGSEVHLNELKQPQKAEVLLTWTSDHSLYGSCMLVYWSSCTSTKQAMLCTN